MPLLLPSIYEGLDPKLRSVIEDITARVQAWASAVDGINAEQRLNELSSGIAGLSTVQTGVLQPFGGASTAVPSGYLFCDGSAVSRTTYANLFAVIGTTWGVGNGSTTFNIPNGQGRSFYGKATSGTGSTLGGTFGAIDHTHTGGTVSGSTANESAHTHTVASGATSVNNSNTGITLGTDADVAARDHTHGGGSLTTSAGSAHSHSAGTLAVGASGTGNPPGFVGNWIIKT